MGIWISNAEENEFGSTNSNLEKLKIVKEKLHLLAELVLRLNEKRLSYHEMRAMLTSAMLILAEKQKYIDMITEQFVILRNKIFLTYLENLMDISLVGSS